MLLKIVQVVLNDPNLYACNGEIALKPFEKITEDMLLPCIHGHDMRFDTLEFDSMEDWQAWKENVEKYDYDKERDGPSD